MHTPEILRIKDLARYLNVSRSTVYNWLDANSKYYQDGFPKPIKLSMRARGWLKSEIDMYLTTESYKVNTLETQNH